MAQEFTDDWTEMLDALPEPSEFGSEEEYVEYLCKSICDLKKEVRCARHLNDNLIRIMRERANQKRDLRPKKDHDGYIVIYCQQWTDRDGNGQMVDVWKSLLQTPYDAGIPYALLFDKIPLDLYPVLADPGIRKRRDEDCTGSYPDFQGDTADTAPPPNVLYRWRYRANFRTGLWEMELYTTGNFRVPVNRQPTHKSV